MKSAFMTSGSAASTPPAPSPRPAASTPSLRSYAQHERLFGAVGVAAATLFLLSGCERDERKPNFEYAPDMADSVPYDAFAPNPNLADGKTLQPMPAGTIARGETPLHYGSSPQEAERAGRELTNPFSATPANIIRGEKVFGTFCTPCHGAGGLGDGPIVPRFPAPPSLLADHAKGLPDGRIFHIVTNGQNLMPSYAVQVLPDDRWKVVLYLRTLQNGKGGPNTGTSISASTGARP